MGVDDPRRCRERARKRRPRRAGARDGVDEPVDDGVVLVLVLRDRVRVRGRVSGDERDAAVQVGVGGAGGEKDAGGVASKPGRRVARKATLGHPQTRPRVTKAVKVARSAPRSIPSGGDARDGREPRKRTASDVFAPSASAGPSTPSPAKKKAKKRASGARAPVGERKVKGKRSVAAGGKKRLVDEDLANCYAAMHSCTDLGDVEQCETLRKNISEASSKYTNPYNWWHEVVPCAARDSKRPIEVLTWALERGAPLDPAWRQR